MSNLALGQTIGNSKESEIIGTGILNVSPGVPMRALLFAPLALTLAAQSPKEIPTTQKDLQGLAVTIYNDSLALVKDQREVRLPKGEVQLAFQEVNV